MRPLARKENIVVKEREDETIVFDLRVDRAICLNLTSAAVWKHCDGENDAEDIARILSEEFNQPVSNLLVELAIDQLEQENLVVYPEMSRYREHSQPPNDPQLPSLTRKPPY